MIRTYSLGNVTKRVSALTGYKHTLPSFVCTVLSCACVCGVCGMCASASVYMYVCGMCACVSVCGGVGGWVGVIVHGYP